ncbi:MAG: glycosyltransferase family 4 protein, partial [Acidobacteriota bacterium]
FDFDDALYLPPPSVPQDERTRKRYRKNFLATVAAADLVICGNRELERHVTQKRTEVLPTAVDCERFRPDTVRSTEAPIVGWVGHADNLPFLEGLAEPLREVARRHPGFRLVVVADRPPRIEGLPIEFRVWKLEDVISCFDGIKVGLMPLDDTPWTRAKCAFKALQYMALGIPPVVSPVGMNREVVEDGDNGFLAETGDDWVRSIDVLLGDHQLARRLADDARKKVEKNYSLDMISRRLVAILGELCA